MSSICLPARLESLDDFLRFVAERSEECGLTPRRSREIQLAVEEVVVNIIRHAYPDSPGDIELRWRTEGDGARVTVEVEDSGVPFDIRTVPEPDLKAGLAERKIGGLGIHFIRTLADRVDYRRENGKNILTLVLDRRRPEAEAGPSDPLTTDDGLSFPFESMTRETFKKGDVLFKAGDVADKMFYIARGSLRLPEIGKVVKEGGLIGEMGILSPFQTRTASAVCEEDLETFTITKDDVIRLFHQDSALAFQLVHLSIKRFIENLRAETEAKERIQSELRIARDIQAAMLPRVFPPFPDRTEFDIFALMEPAKEVGGDFYDFFLIDDKRLCVLVGDVSGKGVPAALFMAICKTLLKTEALNGLTPADILARVNRTLIPDNETMMFVTVFVLILDTETGEMRYANGGHPPPLVSTGPGRFDFLAGPTGTILGAVDGVAYATTTRTLKPGDAIFLYSDGVTEAMNAEQQLFSDERLKASLSGGAGEAPDGLIRRAREAVRAFAAGTPPSDDITMVALEFRGPARKMIRP